MALRKAQRRAQKIKVAIQGGSGFGKTRTGLGVLTALLAVLEPGKRIAVVDTEGGSSEAYAPPFDFDVDADFGPPGKENYDPEKLIEKLEAIRKDGSYGGVIVDNLTYFWKEAGGLTAKVDALCDAQRARGKQGDSFAAWKTVDPIYRRLMTYLRNYPLHLFVCVRCKQAYDRSDGKVKKIGLEPEFRDGYEWYFDAQFAIDSDHTAVPLKHRLGQFLDGKVFRMADQSFADALAEWITAGAPGQDEAVKAATIEAVPDGLADAVASLSETPLGGGERAGVLATDPGPESIPSAQATDALVKSLQDAIVSAKTVAELTAVQKRVSEAKSLGSLTPETLKGLSSTFSKRSREIKASEQAA